MWLTIIDGPSPAVDVRADNSLQGKKGLTSKVIIHLDLHEDLSPDADGRPPCHPPREQHEWHLGYVAGEQPPRERRPQAHQQDQRHRRRDDDRRDDDDDDRRGRPDDRSWAGRLFRSRSRAQDDRSRGAEDRRRDTGRDDRRNVRYDDRRDRRRSGVPDQRKVDTARFHRLTGGCVVPALGMRRRGASSPPSRRPSLVLSREEARGRSLSRAPGRAVQAGRLASIVCIGADGPPIYAPPTPRRAPLSGASSPSAPRTSCRAMSCSRCIDFSSPGARSTSRSLELSTGGQARTPVHGNDEDLRRTPPSTGLDQLFDANLPILDGPLDETLPQPLFVPQRSPLLIAPASPRPAPPVARRKTLAGVKTFNLPRSSPRLKRKN
nr:uncharacterized protein LOC127340549 [Lolium perenne]